MTLRNGSIEVAMMMIIVVVTLVMMLIDVIAEVAMTLIDGMVEVALMLTDVMVEVAVTDKCTRVGIFVDMSVKAATALLMKVFS
jgi:hypothetical protein